MTKMNQALDKALEVIETLDKDRVSLGDFEKIIELFVNLIEEIKVMKAEEMSELTSKTDSVLTETTLKADKILNAKSTEVVKRLNRLQSQVQSKLAQVKDGYTPVKGKDYFDGKSPSVDEILPLVLEQLGELPTREEIVEEVTKEGEAIRDALELLQGKDRLDVSAIRGLEELIKKHGGKGGTMYVSGAGGQGGRVVKVHDLSADLDGSTSTFSLPAFYRVLTVDLSSFPNALRPTVDYTTDASAMTITFTSEIDAATQLASGQTCIITYAEI